MPTTTDHIPADLSHQQPGADVTAIKEGDRITLLAGNSEYAIKVRVVHPARPNGEVYLSGPELNRRGIPSARGGSRALNLSGPAGDRWDWYRLRQPASPGQGGNKHRLIRIEGDGEPLYRGARAYNASATITVATQTGRRANVFQDPALELTVTADGGWTLRRWPAEGTDPALLASGHIDDIPPNTAKGTNP